MRSIKRIIFTESLIPIDSSLIKNFWKETLVVVNYNNNNKEFIKSYKNFFVLKWLNLLITNTEYTNSINIKHLASKSFIIKESTKMFSDKTRKGYTYINMLEVKSFDIEKWQRNRIVCRIMDRNFSNHFNNTWNWTVIDNTNLCINNDKDYLSVLDDYSNNSLLCLNELFLLKNSNFITSKTFLEILKNNRWLILETEIEKQFIRACVTQEIIKYKWLNEFDFSDLSINVFDEVTTQEINEYFYTNSFYKKINKTDFMKLFEDYSLKSWMFDIDTSFIYMSQVLSATNSLLEFFNYISSLFNVRITWWKSRFSSAFIIEFLRITRNYRKKKNITEEEIETATKIIKNKLFLS